MYKSSIFKMCFELIHFSEQSFKEQLFDKVMEHENLF
jgi:hypothetical protein